MQTATKLKTYQRFQAAYRYLSPFEEGTKKSVLKRYRITEKQLERACRDFENQRFTKSQYWDPNWDADDVVHHVLDTSIAVDIEKGAPKGSDFLLFMDPEFDSANGFYHAKWDEDDIEALLAGLPDRALEIMRESKPHDECYQDALAFCESDLFRAICKKFGLDAEILLIGALEITKADL